MGQILHKCATTTRRIRTEIQQSKESVAVLAKKFGINIKTVYKWKIESQQWVPLWGLRS